MTRLPSSARRPKNHGRLHVIILGLNAHATNHQQAVGPVATAHRMLGEEEAWREVDENPRKSVYALGVDVPPQ